MVGFGNKPSREGIVNGVDRKVDLYLDPTPTGCELPADKKGDVVKSERPLSILERRELISPHVGHRDLTILRDTPHAPKHELRMQASKTFPER
jgi:hypothetical protein